MFKKLNLDDRLVLGPVPAKGSLFALPVLIHPQLAEQNFPTSPVLPHFSLVHKELARMLDGEDAQQSYVVLDRMVSPSFLSSTLAKNIDQMTSTLVNGHVLEQEDPYFQLEDWITDNGIHKSKHVLGFIAGAIYRRDEDPNDLSLLTPQIWSQSIQKKRIESLLSQGSSMLVHQVLAPSSFEDALFTGFEGLCRMYLNFHGEDAHVDADLKQDGSIVLIVSAGHALTEFDIGTGTLEMPQVEELLQRLNKVRDNTPVAFARAFKGMGEQSTSRFH